MLIIAVHEENEIEELLYKFQLQKAVRICAWMRRFAHKSLRSRGAPRAQGPLTTEETNSQRLFWEKQAQKSCDIDRDCVALNLQPNQEGLLECRGRIQGEYPVYIPETSMLGLRLVEEAHQVTMHGGVGLTMAKVRNRTETASEESAQELSWVQEVSSIGVCSPAARKPADYSDSRNQPVSSDCSGLR